jgi:hypothetical protein
MFPNFLKSISLGDINPQGGGMRVQLHNVELKNSRFQLLPLYSLNQAKREADA